MSDTPGGPLVVARRLVASLLVAALLASCTTSVRRVRLDDLPGGIRAGDRVRVTRTDGSAATFDVTAVSGDTLRGSRGEIVALSELQGVEVVTQEVASSTLKTAGVVLAVAAFVGLLALLFWGIERGVVQQ